MSRLVMDGAVPVANVQPGQIISFHCNEAVGVATVVRTFSTRYGLNVKFQEINETCFQDRGRQVDLMREIEDV